MGVVGAVMCVVAVLAEAGGLFNVKLLCPCLKAVISIKGSLLQPDTYVWHVQTVIKERYKFLSVVTPNKNLWL